MAVPLAESILKVFEKGLDAYKTHLATRQEAYNRKQDKKQVKAIEAGEKGFFAADRLVTSLKLKGWDTNVLFKDDIKDLKKHRARFFKNN